MSSINNQWGATPWVLAVKAGQGRAVGQPSTAAHRRGAPACQARRREHSHPKAQPAALQLYPSSLHLSGASHFKPCHQW